jgi:hypothetical protein
VTTSAFCAAESRESKQAMRFTQAAKTSFSRFCRAQGLQEHFPKQQ